MEGTSEDKGRWHIPGPPTFEAALNNVYTAREVVMRARQHKYGSDNINATGLLGIAVRLRDKWERLWRYASKLDQQSYADESLRDTLIDLGNYADIALMLIDGTWGLPMEDDPPRCPKGHAWCAADVCQVDRPLRPLSGKVDSQMTAQSRLMEIAAAHQRWVDGGLTREGEARFVNDVLIATFETPEQREAIRAHAERVAGRDTR